MGKYSKKKQKKPKHAAPKPKRAPMSNGTKKKIVLGIILLLTVSALGVITTFTVIGMRDLAQYDKTISNYLDIRHNGNIPEDSVRSLAPEEYWQYIQRTYGTEMADFMDDLRTKTAESTNRYREDYGIGYTTAYDASNIRLVGGGSLGYIRQYLQLKYGISPDRIEKAYTLDLELIISGNGRQNTQNLPGYCVILIDSIWYVTKTDLDGSFTTVFFTPDLF